MKAHWKDFMAFLIVGTCLCTVSGRASGQPYSLEMNLDGIVGNGPDTVSAGIGDTVAVDVWIMGEGLPLFVAEVTVCNPDESLAYTGWTLWPFGWLGFVVAEGSCVTMYGDTMVFTPCPVPSIFATLEYEVAGEQTLAALVFDLGSSACMNTAFETYSFEDGIGGFVQVSATAIGRTSWGTIKNLFR